MKQGVFSIHGEFIAPYSLFTSVPHNVDRRKYAERCRRDKLKCVDYGKCSDCLDMNCRIIPV